MEEILTVAAFLFAAGISTGFAFRGTMHKEVAALRAELYTLLLKLESVTKVDGVIVTAEVEKIAVDLRKKL